jgi:pyruvate dehydrogenase complex dehydrogenase (E1) component
LPFKCNLQRYTAELAGKAKLVAKLQGDVEAAQWGSGR